jgi:allophanate hydrolase
LTQSDRRAAGLHPAGQCTTAPHFASGGVALLISATLPSSPKDGEIAIAVVGKHLSAMPLNGELKALGGRLLEATTASEDCRLYALCRNPHRRSPV